MNIHIGENIKRLRQRENITQEKLAEYLNVSAPAVSKWERCETFPDITMILPIASFFDVSIDELFGYDTVKVEETIQKRLDEFWTMQRPGNKFPEALEFITAAHKEFPNDFRIMCAYMYHIIGGAADNNEETLLRHSDELVPLCDRVLDECTDDRLRREATDVLAKIHRAKGDVGKAVSLYDDFPNWYETKNQKLEQLFGKDTDEFRTRVEDNMVELGRFFFNKIGKVIWYSDKPAEEKDRLTKPIIEAAEKCAEATGYKPAYQFIAAICHEAGKCLNVAKQYALSCDYYDRYLHYRQYDGKPICLEWFEHTPFLDELRKTERFRAILDKYRA